jgi:phage terminase Nu1 subunit (DNA packaging protein)
MTTIPPMTERYVTAAELARLMAVSLRTIQRLTADGMPSETWGMGHTRRYLPSEALTWARDRRTTIQDVNTPNGAPTAVGTNQRRR